MYAFLLCMAFESSKEHLCKLLISFKLFQGVSVQFSSVTQSCLTLCDPMNRSTPGLPVHHQLPESTQTYAHRVGDAIQGVYLIKFSIDIYMFNKNGFFQVVLN